MTTWTCVRCGRPGDESRLATTVSPHHRIGRCLLCNQKHTFIEQPVIEPMVRADWMSDVEWEAAQKWDADARALYGVGLTTDGETRKQRGMAAVETAEAIGGTWVDRADAAIAQLAQRGTPFSAEDVARIAGRPDHPNAVGARMNAAARRGVIEWTGEIVTANRPERHASALRLWRGAAA